MIQHLFHNMDFRGFKICGFAPTDNPYFSNDTIAYGKYFCGGWFFLEINDKARMNDTRFEKKEDWARCCLHIKQDDCIMRCNYIAAKTRYMKNEGGINYDNYYNDTIKEVQLLLKEYPDIVKLKQPTRQDRIELKMINH